MSNIDPHSKFEFDTPSINFSPEIIAPSPGPHQKITKLTSSIFAEIQAMDESPQTFDSERWQTFVDGAHENLGAVFSDVVNGVRMGAVTLEEKIPDYQCIRLAIENLQKENLIHETQGKSLTARGKVIDTKLSETLEKMDKAWKTVEVYEQYYYLSGTTDEPVALLNDQTEDLKSGGGDFTFKHYRACLNELRHQVAFANSLSRHDNIEVRRDILEKLNSNLSWMAEAREEFMEVVEEFMSAALDEAQARFDGADDDDQRITAWKELKHVQQVYADALADVTQLDEELSSIIRVIPEETLVQSAQRWIGIIGNSLLHPLSGLTYDAEEELANQANKWDMSLSRLLTHVKDDKAFLQKINDSAKRTLERISTTSSLSLPDTPATGGPLPRLTTPLTALGMKRMKAIEEEHAFRAGLQEEPDEDSKVLWSRIFLGMQLFSGLQWVMHDLPQQAATFKEQAEKLKEVSAYEKMKHLPPERRADLNRDLLVIEGILKGYVTLTDEQFDHLQATLPALAAYIQDITGMQKAPFAVIATPEWIQKQLTTFVEGHVAGQSPAIRESFWEEIFSTGASSFFAAGTSDSCQLAVRSHGDADFVEEHIHQQGSTIESALRWRGAPSDNTFMQELMASQPVMGQFVQNCRGRNLSDASIKEVRHFFERCMLNAYVRFSYQATAYANEHSEPMTGVIVTTASDTVHHTFQATLSPGKTKALATLTTAPPSDLPPAVTFVIEAHDQGMNNIQLLRGEVARISHSLHNTHTGQNAEVVGALERVLNRLTDLQRREPQPSTPLPDILEWLGAIDNCLADIVQVYQAIPEQASPSTLDDAATDAMRRLEEVAGPVYTGWFSSSTPNDRLDDAMKEKDLAKAEAAINDGVKLNSYWNTPYLSAAVRAGYKPIVELMLRKGAHIDAKTTALGWTAAHEAVETGNLDIFKVLAEQGRANLNIETLKGQTPLILAIQRRDRLAFVQYLVDAKHNPAVPHKPNLDQRSSKGMTALHLAVEANDPTVVRILIEGGADLEVQTGSGKRTALHLAITTATPEITKLLIDHHAVVQARDDGGSFAIHLAAEQADARHLSMVHEAGGGIHLKDNEGNTALHRAIMTGRTENIRNLISWGANINSANNQGMTPALLAVKMGNTDLLQLFIDNGADLTSVEAEGKSAFLLAVESKNDTMIRFLINQGVDLSKADMKGKTALIAAMLDKNYALAKELISANVNMDSHYNGQSAPLLALQHKQYDLLDTFINKGANLNLRDNSGQTILHHAIIANEPLERLVQIVDGGADVNIKDNDGATPIAYAHSDIKECKKIEFLLSRGAEDLFSEKYAQTVSLLLLNFARTEEEHACVAKIGSKRSDEYLFRKLLGHVWDLGGTSAFDGTSFRYEGLPGGWGQPFLASKIRNSIQKLTDERPDFLSADMKDTFLATLDSSMDKNTDTAWARFQQGLPVLLHTGFSGHAMNIVLIDSYMIVCNRGAISSQQLEAYHIERDQLTYNSLAAMNLVTFAPPILAIGFYKIALGWGTRPRQDAVTKALAEYGSILNYQTVGNCSWESMEAAIFTLFIVPRMVENMRLGKPAQDGVEEFIAKFDDWQKAIEGDFLEEYLVTHEEGSLMAMDEGMLDTIFTKAGDSMAQGLERIKKYTVIAQGRIEATDRHAERIEGLQRRYQVIKGGGAEEVDIKTAGVAASSL